MQQYELHVKRLDVNFDAKLMELFRDAHAKGLFEAARTEADYWAAGVSAYFDAGKAPAATREALAKYDPALFNLAAETMAYDGHVDWRFQP